jgi:molybdopterin-guanine dinucleotide biosynthesis protein A
MGFAYGLRQLQASGILTPWVMALACDLPCLNATVLMQWIDGLSSIEEGALAALPAYKSPDDQQRGRSKQWEPLCGFYRASCLRSLEWYIDEGGRSFQRWLRNERVAELATTIGENCLAQAGLINCNTPDELEAIQAHFRH